VDEIQAERLVRKLHDLLFARHSGDAHLGPTWREDFAAEKTDTWWSERADELLEIAGSGSPVYVYDEQTLDNSVAQLKSMESIDQVYYSIKANSHPEILRRFFDAGLGMECVSPGEVERVLELFGEPARERILFTPNFAPRSEYALALEKGVQVTLDNLHPLQSWPELFKGKEIFIRVDPGRGRGHHKYVRTAGAHSKFGVSPGEMGLLASLVESCGATVIGLHAHAGSGVLTPEGWAETGAFLAAVAERFPQVQALNLGGGLGIPEKPGQAPLDTQAIDSSLASLKEEHSSFSFYLEPGRFLVGQAGVLLARVTQIKTKGDLTYVGIDAGMNSLIRPALYGAYHEIVNLSRYGESRTQVAHVVGPICETGDTLGYARSLAPAREGDVILIGTAGAYGRAMSSNYNLRPPAREVMLSKKAG
jgi:diaminopimelate decarboxylase/aspartate kinase